MTDITAPASCPECQATHAPVPRTPGRCTSPAFPVEAGLVVDDASRPAEPGHPSEATILCADDDRLIRQMLHDMLGFHGYTVLEAEDGPAALRIASDAHPALILLDVMMPGMDGFEVCRSLQADRDLRSIPVVMLTAMADPSLNGRAAAAGAVSTLPKSAAPAELLRTVGAALAHHAMRGAVSASETPPAFAIPIRRAHLTVVTLDGASFRADTFLRLQAERHAGPETVQDRLNDSDQFLTLAAPGDPVPIFLNKREIVRVETDPEPANPPADAADAAPGETVPVRVVLGNGERLDGAVRIEGPTGQRRLSDFLNAPSPFVQLEGPDRVHLLHRRHIARVAPDDPGRRPAAR